MPEAECRKESACFGRVPRGEQGGAVSVCHGAPGVKRPSLALAPGVRFAHVRRILRGGSLHRCVPVLTRCPQSQDARVREEQRMAEEQQQEIRRRAAAAPSKT